jgi:hypothetical protein
MSPILTPPQPKFQRGRFVWVRILPPLLLERKGLAATQVPLSLADSGRVSPVLYPAKRNSGLAREPSQPPEVVVASLKKRGWIFYVQYYLSGEQRRVSTDTDNLQIAKEKLRPFESAGMRGYLNLLPTKTPIADVVTAYVEHICAVKTAKSPQTDIYYLRDAFGRSAWRCRLRATRLSRRRRLAGVDVGPRVTARARLTARARRGKRRVRPARTRLDAAARLQGSPAWGLTVCPVVARDRGTFSP